LARNQAQLATELNETRAQLAEARRTISAQQTDITSLQRSFESFKVKNGDAAIVCPSYTHLYIHTSTVINTIQSRSMLTLHARAQVTTLGLHEDLTREITQTHKLVASGKSASGGASNVAFDEIRLGEPSASSTSTPVKHTSACLYYRFFGLARTLLSSLLMMILVILVVKLVYRHVRQRHREPPLGLRIHVPNNRPKRHATHKMIYIALFFVVLTILL
jgi:hypothetical protein